MRSPWCEARCCSPMCSPSSNIRPTICRTSSKAWSRSRTAFASSATPRRGRAERFASEQAALDRLLEEKKAKLAQGEAELAEIKHSTTEQAQAVTDLNELIDRLDAQIAKVEVAQYDAEVAAERALREREQAPGPGHARQ